MNHFTLIEQTFPTPSAMDIAVSHSVLKGVSNGELGGVLRLHAPGPVVAFGRADRVVGGYSQAVRASEAHGFAAVERLAGGRAAVFHERTLAFSWVVPDPEPQKRTMERFQTISSIMAEAFTTLGVDAKVGEIPGEYCPGEFSINIAGRIKVMGVGQRVVRGAAHVGGVVVVDQAVRIRNVLVPVYRALGLDWDPRTAGAIADRAPGVDGAAVSAAIIESFGSRFEVSRGVLPSAVVARAEAYVPSHIPQVA